jgi:hypothetical protein
MRQLTLVVALARLTALGAAERAVALWLERVGQGGRDGQKPSRVFLEPSLVARQSCVRRGISHISSLGDD